MHTDSKNIMKRQASWRMFGLAVLAISALTWPVLAEEPKPPESNIPC